MIRGGLVTLYVRDVSHAVRFYVETLGMKLVEEATAANVTWAVIDAGEGFRIGLHAGDATLHGAGAPSIGLSPKLPLDEAVAIFENRGVVFTRKEEGAVRLANFADPDGNALYLFEAR